MKINHVKRIANMRKIHITDGYHGEKLTPYELAEHLGMSLSHARKIVNGEFKLKPVYEEWLKLKVIGAIPGWDGWQLSQGKLWSPSGRSFTPDDLDHHEYVMNLLRLYEKDMKTLLDRVQALEDKLDKAQARELRVYVNDEKQPRIRRPLKQNTA